MSSSGPYSRPRYSATGGVSLGTTRVCAGQEELVEAVDKLAEGVDSLQDGVQSLKTDMRATREGIDHISQEEETLIRITELMCIYLAATQNERDACGIG